MISSTYTVAINNFPLFMRLGLYASERMVGQNVLVTIEAHLSPDLERERGVVGIENTLDYGQLLHYLINRFEGHEFELIETVINIAAEELLDKFASIFCLNIEIKKPVLPGNIARNAEVSVKGQFKRTK